MGSKFIKYIHLINLLAVVMFLYGCDGCSTTNLPVKPDKKALQASKEQKYEVQVERMDQELFEAPATQALYHNMEAKYGYFWGIYLNHILGIGNPSGQNNSEVLRRFTGNKEIRGLYSKSNSIYKDFTPFKEELSKGFSLYHYYFPKEYMPRIVTFIGLFDFAHPFTDSVLGIGLECYLGADFKPYRASNINYPEYKLKFMNKYYVVSNTLKAFAYSMYEPSSARQPFLNRMIQEGRILYLLDRMMPQVHDTIKMEYTTKQLEWCYANEPQIWAHFIDKKQLFSTSVDDYSRYLKDAPFTAAPDFPSESAPRAGIWTGWQIVRKYMEKNPAVTLPQLMQENDYQKILKLSGYKPR